MSTSMVTIDKKQWKSFCKALEGLARQCNDVDINDGIIRQRSNDYSAVFEVDLRAIVGGSTFTLTYFEKKLKMLKTLTNRVTIEPEPEKVVFADGVSSYSIQALNRSYLDNKFMTLQEMDSVFPGVFQETSLLIRNKIEKMIRKRTRVALSKLNANTYKVVFNTHSASLRVEEGIGSNKPNLSVNVIRDIPLFQPTTGYTRLSPLPFQSFDCDGDMGWEVYRVGKNILSKNHGRIGGIIVTTYTRGELKNDPPEPLPQPEETPEGGRRSDPES